ncbi:secreted phosphoprotein 24-like [Myripristis murdjan]|uniref:secreted phosphoprotein 24-like n=1 Tax=Myripristis murdjan TaxID=586833 RepID=UPI001175FB3A|nr:secreted phosphoprotein 24-like [Myripristis murdjan]
MVYQAAAASVSRINQLNPGPRLYRASHATVHRISRLNRSHELLLELVVRETQCGRALMRQLDRCAIRPGPAVLCFSLVQVSTNQTAVNFLSCSQSGGGFSSSSSTSESLENGFRLPPPLKPPIIINVPRNTNATVICDGVFNCVPFLF